MNHTLYTESGIIIPHTQLTPEALKGLIEEFVSRDGTDTGYTRLELQERVEQVMRQLRKETSVIVFDEKSQTVNIVAVEDLERKHKS